MILNPVKETKFFYKVNIEVQHYYLYSVAKIVPRYKFF